LPWINTQNNFQPLNSLDWQIHVFGAVTDALRVLANRWNVPVFSFAWAKQARSAGFSRNAAYLVRPDGHIALAQPEQASLQMENYLSQWLMLPGN
ncbi:MAG TPA: monooxygenase, partial [Candidatus Angelobacter sp.]|nr:monooxygenase [Candidatus Angelobacter sp.]